MYKITFLPDAEDTFKKLDKPEETWGLILNIKTGWMMYETQHSLNATNGYRWVSLCSTQPTLNACKISQMVVAGFHLVLLHLMKLAGKQCNIAGQKHGGNLLFYGCDISDEQYFVEACVSNPHNSTFDILFYCCHFLLATQFIKK